MNGTSLTDTPYKGLMPYAKEDAAFFFGRERERELITANLMASRLTLLYGPSGVGKSSVINAGVANALQELARRNIAEQSTPESVIVTFNSWRDDPLEGIENQISSAIRQIMPGKECEQPSSGTLIDRLQRWTECIEGELLIVLDQFEEYFLYHSNAVGEGTFAVELPRAINRPDLRVNFLISIREDALAKLDFFKGRIPGLFDCYLRIDHLARKSARDAIELPIEKYNSLATAGHARVVIEPELVDAVLDQVKIGQVLWSGSGQGAIESNEASRIETPYLQLVMTRLWSEELLAGSHTLRLQTLTQLGGAASIVRTHLDKTMSAFSLAEQDIAAQMFRYLVTPSGSKIALTVSDLLSYTELPETEITSALRKLSEQGIRILRAMNPLSGPESATRYEIFHDVLAASILDWQARHIHGGELSAVRKNTFGLILPGVLGFIADLFSCFVPAGILVVWLMLRRKNLGLKKELVNSVAIGWGVGWMAGWLVYIILQVVLVAFERSLASAHPDADVAFLVIVAIAVRLCGPAGGVLAFLHWQRKTLAKLNAKPSAALPALS